ncbi:hypothetical protein HDU81_008710 [Chytriomyces hyalinus]|nr:hypothetical protein HDU81_008710 [Chytriomyces hyalinus]
MLSLGVGAQHHNLHMQQQNYQHLDHDAKVTRAEIEADKAHKEAARLRKLCEDATDDRTVDKYMMLYKGACELAVALTKDLTALRSSRPSVSGYQQAFPISLGNTSDSPVLSDFPAIKMQNSVSHPSQPTPQTPQLEIQTQAHQTPNIANATIYNQKNLQPLQTSLQTPSYSETPSVSANQSFAPESSESLSAQMDDGTSGGSRPFVCPLFSKCGKAYKEGKSLSAHIKTAKVHKVKEDRIVLARFNFGNPIEGELLAELSPFPSATLANVKTSKQRSTMNSAFSAAADVLLDAAAQHESQSHAAETSGLEMNSSPDEQSLPGESSSADESTKQATGQLPMDATENVTVDIEADDVPEPSTITSSCTTGHVDTPVRNDSTAETLCSLKADNGANTENSASLAASCIAAIGAVVAPKSTPATGAKANKRKTRGGSTEPHVLEMSYMEEGAALQSSDPAGTRKEIEGAATGAAAVKKRKTRSNSIAEAVEKPDLHAVARACEYIEVVSKSPKSKRGNTPVKQTQIRDALIDYMEVDVVGNLSDDEEVGAVAKPAGAHDSTQPLSIQPAKPEVEMQATPLITPQPSKPHLEESVPAQTSKAQSGFTDLATEPLSTEAGDVDASVPERNEESRILSGAAVDATPDAGDVTMDASVDTAVATAEGTSVNASADANVAATKAVTVEASTTSETAVDASVNAAANVKTATDASAAPITVLKSPAPKQNTAALTSATPSVKPTKPAVVEFTGPFECEPGFKPVLGDPRSGWHYNLKFGAIVDVYSRSYRAWYPGRVMFYIVTAQNTYKVKIHYIGYAKQYDEVFDLIDPIKREYIRPYVPISPGPETRSTKPATNVVTAEAATLWDLGDAAGAGDWHGTVYEGVKDATRDGAFLLMKEPVKKRK